MRENEGVVVLSLGMPVGASHLEKFKKGKKHKRNSGESERGRQCHKCEPSDDAVPHEGSAAESIKMGLAL